MIQDVVARVRRPQATARAGLEYVSLGLMEVILALARVILLFRLPIIH